MKGINWRTSTGSKTEPTPVCIQNIYSFSVTEADCIEAVRITVALIEFLLLVTRLFALNKGNYRFS